MKLLFLIVALAIIGHLLSWIKDEAGDVRLIAEQREALIAQQLGGND